VAFNKESRVSRVCVVYHSGYGHTKVQADAVAGGARLGRRVAAAADRWRQVGPALALTDSMG
jgi:hypothetical protein